MGEGEERHLGELRALAQRLDVADRVRLTGPVADPLPVLDGADIVLVCSRDEAFGRVTVEAMKRGRPVVGAGAGATPDLIDHGVSGLLYPPGNARALAAEVAGLLADHERRAAVGRAGWQRAVGARIRASACGASS